MKAYNDGQKQLCHHVEDRGKKVEEENEKNKNERNSGAQQKKNPTTQRPEKKQTQPTSTTESSFFKTYDCRGKYGVEAIEQNCFRLGAACNAFSHDIVLGMDYRQNNDSLASAFLQGFGGRVRFAGYLPSPALAYNSKTSWATSFTASHNPPEYNGVKFKKLQRCFFENELEILKQKYDAIKPLEKIEKKELPPVDETVKENYVAALPNIQNSMFDLAGGAACALKNIFSNRLYDQPDPSFLQHAPEPKDGTVDLLQAETKKQNQVGFAFDGDADRCVAIDQGKIIDGSILAAFIALHHIPAKSKIFVTLDTQAEVFRFLQDQGFQTVYTPVGDVHIVKAMVEHDAAFAAERSGHYSFKTHMPDSDGIYTAALLSGTKTGDLVAFSKQFKAISLKDEVRFQVDFAALKAWAEQKAGADNVQDIDGVKADLGDYAFLVRASKTEPKVRINVEAADSKKAKKGLDEVRKALKKARKILKKKSREIKSKGLDKV